MIRKIIISVAIIIVTPAVIFFAYEFFLRNDTYRLIHPLESNLRQAGFRKVCEERSDGFSLFGDPNGDYRVFYVGKADSNTLNALFINQLDFSEGTRGFDVAASYIKDPANTKISETIYASVYTAPRIKPVCFSDYSDIDGSEIQIPKNSVLIVLS